MKNWFKSILENVFRWSLKDFLINENKHIAGVWKILCKTLHTIPSPPIKTQVTKLIKK